MENIYQQKNYHIGFGTYPLQGKQLEDALLCAFDVGYRAIDTAQMYANEADVAQIIQKSEIPQHEFFITTKVQPSNFREEHFIPSVQTSLQKLKTDAVDCLLLHWPPAGGMIESSLQLLQEAYQQGLAKHIGVSNYTSAMMKQAKQMISAPICVNQVEFHPLLNQQKLLQASQETQIPLSAYCPVARGKVFQYHLFDDIAKKHGKTSGQVVLRWILQKGVTLQVMSSNPHNIKANYEIDDFQLSEQEMLAIDELNQVNLRIVNHDIVPWAPEWD